MAIELWGRPSSARTQKVQLALAELKLDFTFTLASATMGPEGSVAKGHAAYGVVDTPDYRAMNPNGTVPTIRDGEFVLWESNAIVQYLAMTYAPDLFFGNDAALFASASRWMMWENGELIPPMHNYVRHTIRLPEAERDSAIAESARAQLERAWKIVDGQLAKTEHIAADRWTLGDIPMTIRVHRWALLNNGQVAHEHIARYYEQVKARESFATIADPQMHIAG